MTDLATSSTAAQVESGQVIEIKGIFTRTIHDAQKYGIKDDLIIRLVQRKSTIFIDPRRKNQKISPIRYYFHHGRNPLGGV